MFMVFLKKYILYIFVTFLVTQLEVESFIDITLTTKFDPNWAQQKDFEFNETSFRYPRSKIVKNFPFIVFFGDDRTIYCFGALISNQLVFTSYQCCLKLNSTKAFKVYTAGDALNGSSINEFSMDVSGGGGNCYKHPKFEVSRYNSSSSPAQVRWNDYAMAIWDMTIIYLKNPVVAEMVYPQFNFAPPQEFVYFTNRFRSRGDISHLLKLEWLYLMMHFLDVDRYVLFYKRGQVAYKPKDCAELEWVKIKYPNLQKVWCLQNNDPLENFHGRNLLVGGGVIFDSHSRIVATRSLPHLNYVICTTLEAEDDFVANAKKYFAQVGQGPATKMAQQISSVDVPPSKISQQTFNARKSFTRPTLAFFKRQAEVKKRSKNHSPNSSTSLPFLTAFLFFLVNFTFNV